MVSRGSEIAGYGRVKTPDSTVSAIAMTFTAGGCQNPWRIAGEAQLLIQRKWDIDRAAHLDACSADRIIAVTALRR